MSIRTALGVDLLLWVFMALVIDFVFHEPLAWALFWTFAGFSVFLIVATYILIYKVSKHEV